MLLRRLSLLAILVFSSASAEEAFKSKFHLLQFELETNFAFHDFDNYSIGPALYAAPYLQLKSLRIYGRAGVVFAKENASEDLLPIFHFGLGPGFRLGKWLFHVEPGLAYTFQDEGQDSSNIYFYAGAEVAYLNNALIKSGGFFKFLNVINKFYVRYRYGFARITTQEIALGIGFGIPALKVKKK